mmetsp:Transcript_32865/g.95067  ORF Transcript_32865/g.95067 Transcript_32865/m.95067 type:complete len:227 (-) Transcript_32865:610-1290(-)
MHLEHGSEGVVGREAVAGSHRGKGRRRLDEFAGQRLDRSSGDGVDAGDGGTGREVGSEGRRFLGGDKGLSLHGELGSTNSSIIDGGHGLDGSDEVLGEGASGSRVSGTVEADEPRVRVGDVEGSSGGRSDGMAKELLEHGHRGRISGANGRTVEAQGHVGQGGIGLDRGRATHVGSRGGLGAGALGDGAKEAFRERHELVMGHAGTDNSHVLCSVEPGAVGDEVLR